MPTFRWWEGKADRAGPLTRNRIVAVEKLREGTAHSRHSINL